MASTSLALLALAVSARGESASRLAVPMAYEKPVITRAMLHEVNEQTDMQPQTQTKTAPDLANVSYGPDERNVLDFWKSRSQSAQPSPLLVFIHGGGFRQGDKSSMRASLLNSALDAGFAVASINYRLSHQAPFPAFMHDGGRAVQFLRSKAGEWNIDPRKIAATGNSAGAGISLWLGYHEDLADPDSADPISRQSTRLAVVGMHNGQCTYDPDLFKELGLAPAAEHPFLLPFYGLSSYEELETPRAKKLFKEASAITFVTAGGPPVFITHNQPDVPLTADAVVERVPVEELKNLPRPNPLAGTAVHHPKLGRILKEKLDALGTESVLHVGVKGADLPKIEREAMQFFQRQFDKIG